ncbi:unnamed protein product [Symbiodinium sp. CCMP2456]|nr:unnamed protein product [Symbiodinium sp. CCMP2456]
MTTTTLTAAEAAWRGVDLIDVHAHRVRGRVAAARHDTLAGWLVSPEGRAATRLNRSTMLHQWHKNVYHISADMPFLTLHDHDVRLNGSFESYRSNLLLHSSGMLIMEFETFTVDFVPQWANPVWELLAMNLEAEHDQILESLHQVLAHIPAVNVSWDLFAEDAAPLSAWHRWWAACGSFVLQHWPIAWYLFRMFCDLRGCGCFIVMVVLLPCAAWIFRSAAKRAA